jgi:hypothetical protein
MLDNDMKILLLDDEKIALDLVKNAFQGAKFDYECNPIHWLDRVNLEKPNLNEYQYILCDFNFENIQFNAFELNLSRYIRDCGFENYLIAFTCQNFFDWKKFEDEEFFDEIISKNEIPPIRIIEKRCKRSEFRKSWMKRRKKEGLNDYI